MSVRYMIDAGDATRGSEGDYPTELVATDYDRLRGAIEVLDTLWSVEERYDDLLQNAVDLESAVARLEAARRARIASFPDEIDVEIRFLNRLLGNFLATARAFVDGVQARLGRSPTLEAKRLAFKTFLSREFDAHFSYRLMEMLRNHVQHEGVAIRQALTWIREFAAADGSRRHVLSVAPQIDRDRLTANRKLNRKVHAEVARDCEPMIDLMPNLAGYLQCFARVMETTRRLYEPEYAAAVEAFAELLGRHMDPEWAVVVVRPQGDPERRDALLANAHDLRRIRRIRLRNSGREPEDG